MTDRAHASDGELLAAWGGGDKKAGAGLIERHYPAIERFFAYKVGEQAPDLVQRTFLVCAAQTTDFRAEGSVRAFLFGIARNVLSEHLRARFRDKPEAVNTGAHSIADLSPGVATLVSAHAEQRQLLLALQRIPLDLQILLELYYWEELSLEEVALVLEAPIGTLKSRLHRARGLLREQMEAVATRAEDLRDAREMLSSWLRRVGK